MSDFSSSAAAEPIIEAPNTVSTSDDSFLDLGGDSSAPKSITQVQSMDEIDFEKELMAIRASEEDTELEGVVANTSSDKSTNDFNSKSKSSELKTEPSQSVDEDEIQRLLQESDNNDDDFFSTRGSRQKSSASKTSIAIMNNPDQSIGPDVSMPPDGILENEDGSFSCYVIVPAGKAGMVIGTAGSTVKQMMAESKTKMNLVQDSAQNTGADKPLRIVGERECVLKAKEMVLHLINEGGAPSFVDLHVPKFAVGMIIGNRGATINKLQDEYGVRIQIKPDQNPEGSYRVCQILGDAAKYQNAAQKVLDLVAAVEAKDKARGSGSRSSNTTGDGGKSGDSSGAKTYKHEVHMTVHERAVGRIIGRGGANIKRMMQESGAKIEMDKNNVNSKNGRVVFILSSTSMQSIEEAQDLVNEAAKKPENLPNRDSNTTYYGGIGTSSGGSSARDRLGSRDQSSNRSFSRGYDSRDDSRNGRNSSVGFNSNYSDRKRNPSNRSRSPDFDDSCRTKVIKTEIFSMSNNNNSSPMNMNQNQQMPQQTPTPLMSMGMMPMPNQMQPNNFMPPMMPQMMAPPMMQQPNIPKPAIPPGFPPMMAPPNMPGMPPFPLPGMTQPAMNNTPAAPMMPPPSMPMNMPNPMPPMPTPPMNNQPAPANNSPMPSWPGFPPMPTPASNSSNNNPAPSSNTNSMPSGNNMFEMWMQYAAKMSGNNQQSSMGQSAAPTNVPAPVAPTTPPNKPSNSASSAGSSSNSGSSSNNSSQDAWLKCYKIFMDTMQDKSASNPVPVKKEPEVKKEPAPEPKKDYTKEWQEYMAKLYAAGGAGSQMEAWKKWTEKYQEYLKTHASGNR
ncbi:uncharacterized protein LOC142342753 isoform X2 [Convolutriloba macropyga]|uniref:uncharacterized protein LOC142342753 isoform X2 n=1 Tax=Convolutriloba macropyga TaxID=536237 RepID=UPI003F51ED0C